MQKTQKKIFLHVLCVLLAVSGLAGCLGDRVSAADTKRTVRIGAFPMQGYHDIDADGNVTGMDAEYLKHVCAYTDWELEFVPCDSWDDALERLAHKEIDLVGSAQYSQQRAQQYRYADLASGYTYGMLAVKGDSPCAYGDFEQMKGLSYGMVKTYVRRNEFLQYMDVHGMGDVNLTEYENADALAAALESGEIDVLVHTFTEIRDGWRVIGRFAPMPFYYITYPGNEELMQELNSAVADIKMNEPELENELLVKYFESRMDKTVMFTGEEKRYIEKTGSLVVGYLDGFYPFSYDENASYCGLARQTLDELSGDTGLVFTYVRMGSPKQAREALLEGKIDLCSYYGGKTEGLGEEGLAVTECYATIPRVLIVKKSEASHSVRRLAMTGDDGDAHIYSGDDDVETILCDTQQDCLTKVLNGEADGAVCDSYLAEYLLSARVRFGDLKVQSMLSSEHEIYMMARDDGSPLIGILDKKLWKITDKNINDYMVQDNFFAGMSIRQFLEQNSLIIIGVLTVAALLVVLILGYLLYNSNHIRRLTYKDAELNVWNQSYLMYQAKQLMRTDYRTNLAAGGGFAVAYTNINQFRRYNTLYGWSNGQRLLEIFVEVLAEEIREREMYARSQSDHFILFAEYKDRAELETHWQHIADTISGRIYKETNIHMTITIGMCYVPEDIEDLHVSLAYAIQAADNLKESRKNTLQVYDENLLRNLKERHERERLLESVEIDGDHFETYYQAKVDIRNERVVGAEALIRFKDPTDNGAIRSPYFFVPYYEEVGRIMEIDFFVLECVCKLQKRRMQEGREVVPISCNFSRLHFARPDFPDRFTAVLEKYGVPKELIEVEITETLVVDEMQAQNAKETINELHRRNIRLSIDDFGSGYSSLGVFETIPASVIKLDRSFLINNENRERQVKIMSNIVKLACDLEAQIVCEGVETEKDIALMQEIGASVAQGYRYAKPVEESEFEARLDGQGSGKCAG